MKKGQGKEIVLRQDLLIESGQGILHRQDNVKVLSGYLYSPQSPETEGIVEKVNRVLNREIRLKFGNNKDNQQMRMFRMVENDDVKTMVSFFRELERAMHTLDKEERLVAFAPEAAWGIDPSESDLGKAIQKWIRVHRSRLINEGFTKEDLNSLIYFISKDTRLTFIKDAYSDCKDREGEIKYPDLAMRFILARHVSALLRAKNPETKKDLVKYIRDLLITAAEGNTDYQAEIDEALTSAMKNINTLNINNFLNTIILKVEPVDFSRITQYEEMIRSVARSL